MEKLLKKLPFYNHTWFNFLRFLIRNFLKDNCQQKAASLTYTTLLSIVPILTVLLMILSSIPALESVREQISDLIYSNLLPQSSIQVSQYIDDFAEKSTNLTAIGAMALFITTIMTLTTIERAFNQIWRVENRSGGIKSILRYWTIITLGPLVLGTAFIVSSTVQSLSFLNQQVLGYGIDWGFWVQIVSFAVTIGGFIGMYWFIPKAKVPLKNAAIAGVFVAITFELLKYTFGIVMTNFTSYEAIYGAFAALPIFLLWVYLSWNLILIGVEISYSLTIFATGEVYPRHPLLSLLDMLNLVYDRYQEGDATSEQELRDVLGRKELPKWFTYINYLADSNLITITDDGCYVLKKDLDNITLWDFYRTLPYPLPIKDELEEMPSHLQYPWLTMLIQRFIKTENCAKNELDIPLSQVFSQSPPRQRIEPSEGEGAKDDINNHKVGHNKVSHNQQPLNASALKNNAKDKFEAQAFDPDADAVADPDDEQAASPPDADLEALNNQVTNSQVTGSQVKGSQVKSSEVTNSQINNSRVKSSQVKSNQVKSNQSLNNQAIKPTSKKKQKSGIFSLLRQEKDQPIITEEDNPDK